MLEKLEEKVIHAAGNSKKFMKYYVENNLIEEWGENKFRIISSQFNPQVSRKEDSIIPRQSIDYYYIEGWVEDLDTKEDQIAIHMRGVRNFKLLLMEMLVWLVMGIVILAVFGFIAVDYCTLEEKESFDYMIGSVILIAILTFFYILVISPIRAIIQLRKDVEWKEQLSQIMIDFEEHLFQYEEKIWRIHEEYPIRYWFNQKETNRMLLIFLVLAGGSFVAAVGYRFLLEVVKENFVACSINVISIFLTLYVIIGVITMLASALIRKRAKEGTKTEKVKHRNKKIFLVIFWGLEIICSMNMIFQGDFLYTDRVVSYNLLHMETRQWNISEVTERVIEITPPDDMPKSDDDGSVYYTLVFRDGKKAEYEIGMFLSVSEFAKLEQSMPDSDKKVIGQKYLEEYLDWNEWDYTKEELDTLRQLCSE